MNVYRYCILMIVKIIDVMVNADATIFVTDLQNASIWRAPIDTLEFVQIPLQDIGVPVAVDYDPVEHKVYWTDVEKRAISRAFLDGTEQEILVPYLATPDGISIDVVNRHMYWTDTGTDTIERANLDGSERQIILQEDHDQPRAIVVDSAGGRLFWTDWGANPKIERANLDGSERVTLVNTTLHLPNGLALDFMSNRLYWCDAGHDAIQTTDLNGDNRITLFNITSQNIHPFDIGIYNNYVYWSDWAVAQLLQMDRYAGRLATGVGPTIFRRAGGLHIYIDTVNACSSNPCLNGGVCSDDINQYVCNCQSIGWEGHRCETDSNECQRLPPVCDENANCINTLGSFQCRCRTGYTGDGKNYCADIDECMQTPCDADAVCTNTLGSFMCQCKPGFTGDGKNLCIDIDECASNPCQNGGQCRDMINSFLCECTTGFNGEVCQHSVTSPCYSVPCQNGGACFSGEGQFSCQCLAGFTGVTCETDIDECNSSPCRNGGTCKDLPNKFVCECPVGYGGDICTDAGPTGCKHPGALENGHVIPNKQDTYPPGESVEYVCKAGYSLDGPQVVYCQTDATWSDESPICEQGSKEGTVSTLIVGGAAGGGAVIILILAIILIVVCCRKSRRPSTDRNDLPNVLVHYSTEVPTLPKDEGLYNTAYDSASQQYTSQPRFPPAAAGGPPTFRKPAPQPHSIGRPSMHIYDDLNNVRGADASGPDGRFPSESPPAYLSIIGDARVTPSENSDSEYEVMGRTINNTIHPVVNKLYEQHNI